MLTELRVKNFALIKDLSVHFDKGLNVITGETGAGKSLVLKSLHLLMGGKAPTGLIGSFNDECLVEGLFSLEGRQDVHKKLKDSSYTPDDRNSLLVRRVISNKGRSKTYLNGSLATLNELRNLVSPLIELSGSSEPLIELTNQHDNKNLQNTYYQRDLFDVFCKNKDLRISVSSDFKKLREKEKDLESIKASDSDRLQKIDFLNFQLTELDEFKPKATDYFKLKDLKKEVFEFEKLKEAILSGEERLQNSDQSVLSQLYSVISDLQNSKNSNCSEALKHLELATESVDLALVEIKNLKASSASESEHSLNDIEERLQTYEHLFRKYNTDAEGLAQIYEGLLEQKQALESIDESILRIQEEVSKLKGSLKPLVEKLSLSRTSAVKNFESQVSKNLKELNMKDLVLKVKIEACDLSEFGQEEISFWLSFEKNNAQERSIKQAASGGELSRILLAIKSSLENQEAPRTYLFDEIDAGVSGPTAEKVGKKLKNLSKGQQVITITHLPQVAAVGEHHFLIEKTSGTNGQQTKLKNLNQNERVEEVARLISGEEMSETSLSHAKKLIETQA